MNSALKGVERERESEGEFQVNYSRLPMHYVVIVFYKCCEVLKKETMSCFLPTNTADPQVATTQMYKHIHEHPL